MGKASLKSLYHARDLLTGKSIGLMCSHKLFESRNEPCGHCSTIENLINEAIKQKKNQHPFDDFPHMKLYAGCSECGTELQIEWKSAYTSSNSIGIKVKPCSQCCTEEQADAEKDKCLHDKWEIKGDELPGKCTCLDCGDHFWVWIAVNRLRDKAAQSHR